MRRAAFLALSAVLLVASAASPLFAACPQILVGPVSLPGGTSGTGYTQTVTESGAASATFSITSGVLPNGLNLTNPTATSVDISGTPMQSGSFTFTVTATDANGCTGGRTYRLSVICGTIIVTNPVLNMAPSGANFNAQFTQMGAGANPVFSLASGVLPMGWSLDPVTGILSNPNAATVMFTITVKVTDDGGCTGTGMPYTVTIFPGASPETYPNTIIGNMSIDTAQSTNFSVLANDGPGTTGTLVSPNSAQGGQVTLNSVTGTFTYNPPRGYEGPDSFQYTVTNSGITNPTPTTCSLTVAGMVWFVNNNAAACTMACDGRRTNPYTTLPLFQAANTGTAPNAKINDRIFLYESNPAAAYVGPVTLLNQQRIIGQDATVSLAAATGYTIPADTVSVPVMAPANGFITNVAAGAATFNGINLAQDNSVIGLTASAANDIAIARGAGSLGTTALSDVALSTGGTGSGLALTMTTGTLTYTTGSITAAGSGVGLFVSGGTSAVNVAAPVAMTNTAGRAVDVNARAGGSVTYDGAITATGPSTGITVTGPTAASPVTFTGPVALGTMATRLAGGTALTVTHGGLAAGVTSTSFSSLSIFTQGQTAIDASNGGTLNVTAGAVDAASGRALNLSGLALGVTLTGITSTSAPGQGINIAGSTGSLTNSGATSITGSVTQGILVGTTTANVSFGATTINGGTNAVSLQNNSGGTRTFAALTIGAMTPSSATGFLSGAGGGAVTVTGAAAITSLGNAIDIQNQTTVAAVNFQSSASATRTSAGGAGVNVVGNTMLTLTFNSLTVQTNAGIGLNATGGGTVNVTNGTGTINNTVQAAPAIIANGVALNANFSAIKSSGGADAVSLTNVTGTSNFGGGTLSGSTAATFLVSGGTASTTYAGDMTQANGAPLVSVSGGHGTGTITFQTGTLGATNGTGLQFNNADGTYNFNGTTTLNGGDAGVDILTGSSGTFSFSSGTTITSPTGTAINVDTSAPNVTYAGNVTQNNAQRVVNVNATTGGAVSFTSPSTVTGGASNTGVNIANANGNVSFFNLNLGTLASRTTNQAVTIAGGTGTYDLGNVNIFTNGAQGLVANGADGGINSTTGTIDSLTARAINIVGPAGITTLGMTLTKVNVANGTNGMTLQSTNGSFTVNGDGTGNANGSGGAITNVTNRAIDMITAGGTVTLKSMDININTAAISGMLADNNAGGTLVSNVTGCAFSGVTASVMQNKALLQYEAGGAANVTVNVQGSFFNSSRTYGFFTTGAGTSIMNVTLNQSGFGTDVITTGPVNQPGTAITNPPAFSIGITNGSTAQVDYTVTNNTFWGASGLLGAVYAVTMSGAGTVAGSHLNGLFDGNKIGRTGVVGSGCSNNCAGVGLLPGLGGTFNATVSNNDIRQVNSSGIDFFNSTTGSNITANAKIFANTLAEPDTTGAPLFQRAIVVSPGNSGGANVNACAQIGRTSSAATSPNTITGAWQAGNFIRITNNNNTPKLKILGNMAITSATAPQVNAQVSGDNGGVAVNTTLGAAGVDIVTANCF